MQSFETLVIQSQAHDRPLEERQDAFGKLVTRFQDMAFAQAFERLGDLDLAQDVAQESFLTAYKNLDQLQHALAFPNWFRRIVLTHCNRITRRKQHPTDPIDEEPQDDPIGVSFARTRRIICFGVLLSLCWWHTSRIKKSTATESRD